MSKRSNLLDILTSIRYNYSNECQGMMIMSTKERIMDVALHMFSERGYAATSIRDICGEVGIKESTLYYHFKNKHDILDSLITKFEDHIEGLIGNINMPDPDKNDSGEAQMMDNYMMDSYLFCHLMFCLYFDWLIFCC